MFNLFILILERVGLIIILAYLLMNIHYFRDKLGERQRLSTKLALIVVFGIFAVISNYTGVEISHDQIISDQVLMKLSEGASLANTRVLTIGVAGLIGGPLVGTSVGIISGIIRFFQGGEEAYIYVISSILIGSVRRKNDAEKCLSDDKGRFYDRRHNGRRPDAQHPGVEPESSGGLGSGDVHRVSDGPRQ